MSKSIVVDTSVIIKWLSQDNEQFIEQANNILKDVQNGTSSLIAPELAKYEVGNVLIFGKHLSQAQSSIVLTQFYKLPIAYIEDSEVLSKETVKIATDNGITYYDASFMALAKQNDFPLVTDNLKHPGKAKGIRVIELKDYTIGIEF